jgi:hypothetical protein
VVLALPEGAQQLRDGRWPVGARPAPHGAGDAVGDLLI